MNRQAIRCFGAELKNKELLCEYIRAALYDEQLGYFTNPQNIQLGQLAAPIKFSNLLGYSDYTEQLNINYPKHKFLTPSEIFRPFYGMTMARYVRSQQQKHNLDKIRVVEIGSGMGGQADSFLMYFKNYEPELYPDIEYTLLEISPTLMKKSKTLLYSNHRDKCGRGDIKFVNQDAFTFNEKMGKDVFFMMFEILDNLPHDMVQFSSKLDNIQEAWITSGEDRKEKHLLYQDLSDPYIVKCFEIWKELYIKNGALKLKDAETPKSFFQKFFERINTVKSSGYNVCLPTGFYKLVEHINKNFENPRFLLTDFSSLPGSTRFIKNKLCHNYPILSTKLERSEDHKDYESFEEADFGKCDIFFETDFDYAKVMLEKFGGEYTVSKPKEFIERNARQKWAETRSGYNPMMEDFLNTRFLHQ